MSEVRGKCCFAGVITVAAVKWREAVVMCLMLWKEAFWIQNIIFFSATVKSKSQKARLWLMLTMSATNAGVTTGKTQIRNYSTTKNDCDNAMNLTRWQWPIIVVKGSKTVNLLSASLCLKGFKLVITEIIQWKYYYYFITRKQTVATRFFESHTERDASWASCAH